VKEIKQEWLNEQWRTEPIKKLLRPGSCPTIRVNTIAVKRYSD
jgi:hypothetical protein